MLLVSDANIFMDFEAAELTVQLFELPHEIVVPDTLYREELDARHPHLRALGLQVRTLTGEQVGEAYTLRVRFPGVSVNDLFALVLARSLRCPLVTGDSRLRAAAEAEGLHLLGTLALVEQMVQQALVSVAEVERGYERMRNAGRRLPWDAVTRQLDAFRAER